MVLVLRALGLGDLLTAVPALRALRAEFPGQWLVLAAPAPLAPLAVGCGLVDEVLDTRPLDRLAVRRPEIAVNLHGRGPQSHRRLLEARPGQTIWFRNQEVPESEGSPGWRPDEHEVRRWCRLLVESGIPADPRRLEISAPPGEPPAPARGASLVHPGAAFGARRWPAERWAQVVRAELARDRPVAVTGGPGEEDLAREVAERAGLPPDRVLVAMDLVEMAAAVGAAARVACGDTGIAHLATALGTPSVVLFGPTSPDLWGPPARRRHRVLWAGTSGDPFAPGPDAGLLRIHPREVTAALQDV